MEKALRELISSVYKKGELWVHDWENQEIPSFSFFLFLQIPFFFFFFFFFFPLLLDLLIIDYPNFQ